MSDRIDEKNQQTISNEAAHFRASAEYHKEQLKRFWIELLRSGIFTLAALAVLVFACIAWFTANTRVHSKTASITSQHEIVRIATKGVRQTPERTFLKLSEGTSYTADGETYYYVETGDIALRLSEEYIVSPGASGSVTFYIIPTHDGSMTATLYLELAGYKETEGENSEQKSAARVNDPVLNALLSGHILLFNKYENNHYSEWLSNNSTGDSWNNTITITLPDDTKKDEPYPVTIYWIWPLLYENMKKDLYAEASEEYTARFSPFIESQIENMEKIDGTSYYYSRIFLAKEGNISNLDERTKAYNLADEYIGSNADYLYLSIQTAAFDE